MSWSFGSTLVIIIWVGIPLYAVGLGLAISSTIEHPTSRDKKPATWGGTEGVRLTGQIFLLTTALAILGFFRGNEGLFAQGQLSLFIRSLRLHTLVFYLVLGVTIIGNTLRGLGPAKHTHTGLSLWNFGPLLGCTWLMLPFVTHVTTALLVLELIGVGLVWAISSGLNKEGGQRLSGGFGSAYSLILFIWASGISALALLIAMGLGLLNGVTLGPIPTLGLNAVGSGSAEFLLAMALILKFLIGSGQFILFSWYKLLPKDSLIFYLLFYYPMHLILGVSIFLGLVLPKTTLALGITLVGLGLSLLNILPYLGFQSSPALTLAGSSFVGLSMIILALFNIV